jgi:phage FluMu protein Com
MPDEHYFIVKVECSRCKTKQKVHVATPAGLALTGIQTIQCIKCGIHFKVSFSGRIIRGPFSS